MIVIDCPQHSDEWYAARMGRPTASNFDKILTPDRMQISKQREAYLHDLCEERLEVSQDFYRSRYMDRGSDLEESARAYYSFVTGSDVQQVGLCLNDNERYGCSPDGLIGDEGGFEAKCPKLITHRKYKRAEKVPTIYKLQVLGGLLVTGREWWDFMSFFPGTKPYIFRAYAKDYAEDLETLRIALELFCDDLDKLEKEERL